jgi:hypothetical protein
MGRRDVSAEVAGDPTGLCLLPPHCGIGTITLLIDANSPPVAYA